MPNLNFAEAFDNKAGSQFEGGTLTVWPGGVKNRIKYIQSRVWPDFLASDFKFILAFEEIGPFDCAQDRLRIGFDWVCFFGLRNHRFYVILCES